MPWMLTLAPNGAVLGRRWVDQAPTRHHHHPPGNPALSAPYIPHPAVRAGPFPAHAHYAPSPRLTQQPFRGRALLPPGFPILRSHRVAPPAQQANVRHRPAARGRPTFQRARGRAQVWASNRALARGNGGGLRQQNSPAVPTSLHLRFPGPLLPPQQHGYAGAEPPRALSPLAAEFTPISPPGQPPTVQPPYAQALPAPAPPIQHLRPAPGLSPIPEAYSAPPGTGAFYHIHTLPNHLRGVPVQPSPDAAYFPQSAGYQNRSAAPSPDTAAFAPQGYGHFPTNTQSPDLSAFAPQRYGHFPANTQSPDLSAFAPQGPRYYQPYAPQSSVPTPHAPTFAPQGFGDFPAAPTFPPQGFGGFSPYAPASSDSFRSPVQDTGYQAGLAPYHSHSLYSATPAPMVQHLAHFTGPVLPGAMTLRRVVPPPAPRAMPAQMPRAQHEQVTTSPPPAASHTPPARHPHDTVAASYPEEVLAESRTFVTAFHTHFQHDAASTTAFESLVRDYNRKRLDAPAFYADVYRILYRKGGTHLVPAFKRFLPQEWQEADLGWLEEAVGEEVDGERGGERVRRVVRTASEGSGEKRKKTPLRGYKSAPSALRGEGEEEG